MLRVVYCDVCGAPREGDRCPYCHMDQIGPAWGDRTQYMADLASAVRLRASAIAARAAARALPLRFTLQVLAAVFAIAAICAFAPIVVLVAPAGAWWLSFLWRKPRKPVVPIETPRAGPSGVCAVCGAEARFPRCDHCNAPLYASATEHEDAEFAHYLAARDARSAQEELDQHPLPTEVIETVEAFAAWFAFAICVVAVVAGILAHLL